MKILNYNIFLWPSFYDFNKLDKNVINKPQRSEQIINFLKNKDYDVIILQENLYEPFYSNEFFSNYYEYKSNIINNGMTIYSKCPIIYKNQIVFPNQADFDVFFSNKGAICALFKNVDNNYFMIFNFHASAEISCLLTDPRSIIKKQLIDFLSFIEFELDRVSNKFNICKNDITTIVGMDCNRDLYKKEEYKLFDLDVVSPYENTINQEFAGDEAICIDYIILNNSISKYNSNINILSDIIFSDHYPVELILEQK